MQFTDAVAVAGTRRLADGYLVAEAKCVRTGIQLYSGAEVGKPEMKAVRVHRDGAEVFADASLQSFSHAPITVDHPAEMVTAENWSRLAVGEVSTAAKKDGDWVMLPLILKDAAAIQSVIDGKRELSAGYVCELDFTSGVTADGQAYDARQKNIKINHLALVDRARAGSEARIGDGAKWGPAPITPNQEEEKRPMTDALRTVVVDGLSVQTTDQGAQAITTLLQRIADAARKATETETAHTAVVAAKDKEIATKDAEIDGLKAKILSDADLDKRVAARAELINTAKLIHKDLQPAGLSDADIRKAVVVAKLGDAAKDKPQAYIDARFDILAEDAAKAGGDQFRDAMRNGGGIQPTGDERGKAHNAMTDHLSSAWQNNGKAA
jgi:hypothetical protein